MTPVHNEYIDQLHSAGVYLDAVYIGLTGGILDGMTLETDKVARLRRLFDAYRIVTDKRDLGLSPVGDYVNDEKDARKDA